MIGGFPTGIPPRRGFLVTTAVAAVVVAFAYSTPGLDYVALFFGVLILACLGAAWTYRLVRTLRSKQLPTPTGSAAVRWAAFPAIVLAGLAVGMSGAALELRWLVSLSSLRSTVAGLPVVDVAPDEPWRTVELHRTIGLYPVKRADQLPAHGTVFHDSVGILTDDAGLAELPAGPDPVVFGRWFDHVAFRHLGGDWYAWVGTTPGSQNDTRRPWWFITGYRDAS